VKKTPLPGKKFGMFAAAFCAVLLAFSHHAAALTIGDASTLGYVFLGIPSLETDRLNYVNHIIDMVPGSNDAFSGQIFLRTLNNPGPGFPNYPNAAPPALNGFTTTIDLGPTTGVFDCLFAKYGGPNQGSVVWFVGDLSGSVTIPVSWTGVGLSRWTLFKEEEGGGGNVPDSGSTVVLLGTTLTGLSTVRRYLKR
jgi:VPDSG-CTERM motif